MKKIISFMLLLGLANSVKSQCACCVSPSGFTAAGSSPSAIGLKKGQFLFEAYGDYRSFHAMASSHGDLVPDSLRLKVHDVITGILGVRYGISNKITLILQQPYFNVMSNTNSSNTLGDLISALNITVLNKNNNFISLQAGMEWPTGGESKFSNGNTIITGSGSYDPLAGIAFSKKMDRSLLSMNIFFKYTTRGFNNTWYGNSLVHQLSYGYELLKSKSCSSDSSSAPSLLLNFQCSGEMSQVQVKDHTIVPNTGGYTALLGAGFLFSKKGFSIPITVSVPVYRVIHGEQNYDIFRIRIGITKTFK